MVKADITEIFSSIQGEGLFVGAKQVFVRFKRCNLKCSFCDVPELMPATDYTPEELMSTVEAIEHESGPHHSVSLTGGEPLLYVDFLAEFLPLLKRTALLAFLETNGTLPGALAATIDLIDIIAMDFKLPSSTGERDFWKEHEEFLKIAVKKKVFVKAVVTRRTTDDDIRKSIEVVKSVDASMPFIIQPVHPLNGDNDTISTGKLFFFLDMASKGGLGCVRVIPQVHKVVGVR